jgi:penicillin-binding protein 1A
VPLTFDPIKPPPDPLGAPRPAAFGRGGAGPPSAKPPGRRRPVLRAVLVSLIVLFAVIATVGVTGAVIIGGYIHDAPPMPSRDALWSLRRSPGMTFLDRNGAVIAQRGARYGLAVKLAELPAYVPRAFLAAEDRRFYQHGPVDVQAIVRAALANLQAHRSAQGASTLTQQLARTLFLSRDPSLKRKVQEAYLAWELEQQLSKDEVLELYLNRTYFGDGAYGLDAASRTYFGKPAAQLSVAEAAILAGLPNAPTRLALTNDMPGAVARGHKILQIMREEGWIDDAALSQAMAETPALAPAHPGEGDEGYVIDAAAAQAEQLVGGQTPDLVIRTTIDPALQTVATNAVRTVIAGEGAHRNASQAAVVTLAPDGAVLAMVGGVDHDRSPFNRVTQAHRQPGSSFKAFVYGAAVERGATAHDIWEDGPITYAGWSPGNYEGGYAGKVTLAEALARSLNTVAVRLTLSVGPASVADFARRLGVTDIPADPGPSIALGAYEVTPMEMAAGYQVFQTGGGRTQPYLISEIRSTRGDVVWSHADSAPTPVLDPLYATRMVGMLKGVIQFGTGVAANIGRPAAGKTGTSSDWRDAWFVGFTPDYLTAVWVGNDNGQSMAHVTGGQLPAEIWKKVMTAAEKNQPPRDFPWLVPEPQAEPQLTLTDTTSQTPYEDQPPDMESVGPGAGDMTADGGPGPDADAGPGDGGHPPPGYDDPNPYVQPPPGRDDDDAGPPRDGPGWQGPAPGADDADPPPRDPQEKRQGGPQTPADDAARYRY